MAGTVPAVSEGEPEVVAHLGERGRDTQVIGSQFLGGRVPVERGCQACMKIRSGLISPTAHRVHSAQ